VLGIVNIVSADETEVINDPENDVYALDADAVDIDDLVTNVSISFFGKIAKT